MIKGMYYKQQLVW